MYKKITAAFEYLQRKSQAIMYKTITAAFECRCSIEMRETSIGKERREGAVKSSCCTGGFRR
jgi:hypothetical protein